MTVRGEHVDRARDAFVERALGSQALADRNRNIQWKDVVGVSVVPYEISAHQMRMLFVVEKGGRYRGQLNPVGGKVSERHHPMAQLFDEIVEEMRVVPDATAVQGDLVSAAVIVPTSKGRGSLVVAIRARAFGPAQREGSERFMLSTAKAHDVDPPRRFREIKEIRWILFRDPAIIDDQKLTRSAYTCALLPLMRPALLALAPSAPECLEESEEGVCCEAFVACGKHGLSNRVVGLWRRPTE